MTESAGRRGEQGGASSTCLPDALSVVIPCYNAGARIRPVVEGVRKFAARVVLVDDGSTDGAVAALGGDPAFLEGPQPPLRILSFPHNRGKGVALLTGFGAALESPEVTCVGVVDADGQHAPDHLPALYEAFQRRDADLVIGSRALDPRTVPWRSRFGNHLTAKLTTLLFRQQIPDTQSGFRLHARRFLEAILATVPGGRYETEMAIVIKAIRERRTIVSVPIPTLYEPGNASSHFRVIGDSFRVYRTLFGAWLRS